MIGQHFSRFYTVEDVERGKPQMHLLRAADEGRCEDEGWRVRKDGSRFWANVIITPLRDQKGTLIGFSKITRDLTTRKHAEKPVQEARPPYVSRTWGVVHFNKPTIAGSGTEEISAS
jgi:PAS domain S-box-containing protein